MNRPAHLRLCLRTIRVAALTFATISSTLLGAISGTSAVEAAPMDGTWSQFAPFTSPNNAEAGRTSFTLVLDTARNRLVAFSGDPGPKNDAWTLSLTPGSVWTSVMADGTPPSFRYGAAAIYDPAGDRMIVFGGYSGAQLNDVWALTFAGTPTWTQLSPSGTAPGARQDAAAVYDPVGQRMILFGGYTGFGWSNQSWALSLTGAPAWTQLAPTGPIPSPRNTVAYALDTSRNRLLVFGGWGPTGYLADTHALDLAGGGAWSPIATVTAPPARRQGYAAYDPTADAMLLFGGYAGVNYGDLWRLPLGGTPDWSPVVAAGTPPTARYGGRAAHDPVHHRFLVCGGVDTEYRIDVQALELGGPAGWSTVYDDLTAETQHPGPRRDYSLSVDPSTAVAYMFGGTAGYHFDFFGDVVLEDTDELHAIALANPTPQWLKPATGLSRPSARHGHRSVWDPVRNRLLVFGGYDVGYRNDLWAMVPSPSPAWSEVATLGTPPDTRMLFGMGYDPAGDRLIVIGGHSGFPPSGTQPFRNDVWELPLSGPNALTWAQLAPLGTPPDPRWIYGMVFDPLRSRFLLFGGVTALNRPNDVWALNLGGSTSWSPVPALGIPPTGRSDHAMVYDPAFDRLVVFGGYDGSFRNDAWMLKLGGTPEWTQLLPTGGPPVVRDIMHAVHDLAGGRMVLFGGWGGTSILGDTWALTWIPGVVPVLASFVAAEAEPGLVKLRWFVPTGTRVEAMVERSDGAHGWQAIGAPIPEGVDQLTYADHEVQAGKSYEYRLYLRMGHETYRTPPALVAVPSGFSLELAGAEPNPSAGLGLNVSFTLPRRLPARLTLIDATGRKIVSRDVGELGVGRHRLDLAEGLSLAPGMYLIRLETEQRSFTHKALVLR